MGGQSSQSGRWHRHGTHADSTQKLTGHSEGKEAETGVRRSEERIRGRSERERSRAQVETHQKEDQERAREREDRRKKTETTVSRSVETDRQLQSGRRGATGEAKERRGVKCRAGQGYGSEGARGSKERRERGE